MNLNHPLTIGLGSKRAFHPVSGEPSHSLDFRVRLVCHRTQRARKGVDVTAVETHAGLIVSDQFGDASDAGSDYWFTQRVRFQQTHGRVGTM